MREPNCFGKFNCRGKDHATQLTWRTCGNRDKCKRIAYNFCVLCGGNMESIRYDASPQRVVAWNAEGEKFVLYRCQDCGMVAARNPR